MTTYPVKSQNHSVKLIAGSFRPNGNNAAMAEVVNDLNGAHFTVARTNTGKYRVTFTDRVFKIVSALAFLAVDDLKGILQEAQPPTLESDGTTTWDLRFLESDGAGDFAADDIAADANRAIRFIAVALEASVAP